MNTFLPYPHLQKSAACLDYRRLGKQRVETWQILQALQRKHNGETKIAWGNHPAVLMWEGHELALAVYGLVVCNEWKRRGYKDTMTERFENYLIGMNISNTTLPEWFGKPEFHAAMRSNLLRKDREYYSKFGWSEPDNLPYVWGNENV